ncbi:MAG: hypothetical protein WA188_03165 [Terriglobales bacterium]
MNAKRIVPVLLLLSVSLLAQSAAPDPQTNSKPKKKAMASPTAELANEVHELRRMMETQQQQIQQLQQAVHSRDQQISDLQNAASQARSSAESAVSSSSRTAQTVSALEGTVADIKLNSTNMAATMQEEQKHVSDMIESPLALHYKGITLTPGGFLAAESAWRQHSTASDVNTPFTSIPFPGNDAYHLSEFFGSGRQSRITLLAEGKISSAKLSGYYETDWLSAGVTSNNNQSNSYTNRMRQLWGQVALNNGWSFTGGQQWSLVTETKVGLNNRTEALPMTIDAQYHVGFSWLRQYGFRVVKNFNNEFWIGASVENAQTTNLGGGNFPTNFVIGAPGTGGGLYNSGETLTSSGGLSPAANYSYNYTPDFIVKAAFEPGFGHYEVFGVVSNFRDRVYPTGTVPAGNVVCGVVTPAPAGTPPCNSVRTGGGGGANARWSFFQKRVDFGLHFLGGDGVGRYGSSQLAEATVHPNGTLALIHSYQALETLEWHSKHWDVYTNVGAEYAARTAYLNAAGTAYVGYGRPDQTGTGNCLVEPNPAAATNGTKPGFQPASNGCNDPRDVIEGTFGFWYKAYNGPKGRIQFGPQYSYLVLNTWRDAVAPTPHTIENMFFTSFRYYLP